MMVSEVTGFQIIEIIAEGPKGKDGWVPVLAIVADGVRSVQQVIDWTGSAGSKPQVGKYVGATGFVSNIADAADIRGLPDPGSVAAAAAAEASAETAGLARDQTQQIANEFGDLDSAMGEINQAVEDASAASDVSQAASDAAGAAADAAAATANLQDSVAAGLGGSTPVGGAFTAPLGDGTGRLQAYRKTSTSVATPVGAPFASSADIQLVSETAVESVYNPNGFRRAENNFTDFSRMVQGSAGNITRVVVRGLPAASLVAPAGGSRAAYYRLDRSTIPGTNLIASVLVLLLAADAQLRSAVFSVQQYSAANVVLETTTVDLPASVSVPTRITLPPIAVNPSTDYFLYRMVNQAASASSRDLRFSEMTFAAGVSPLYRPSDELAPTQVAQIQGLIGPLQQPLDAMLDLYVPLSENIYPLTAVQSVVPPRGAAVAWHYNSVGTALQNQLPKYGTSGFLPVMGGTPYTLSFHTAPPLWRFENSVSVKCYNELGVFLYNRPIDGNTVILRAGNRELMFVPPVGVAFAAVNVYTTQSANPTPAEFQQWLDAAMLNVGAEALPFQPPAPGKLKPGPAFNTGGAEVEPNDVVVQVVGDEYFVRTSWAASHDKVQRINAAYNPGTIATGAGTNGTYDHDGERLVPIGTAPQNTFSAYSASTLITRAGNDESPPINLNTAYLAGGHGLPCRRITATSHGKTNVDVGSVWSDGVRQWTLAGIPTASTLLMVAAITGTQEIWILSNAEVVGGTLTHVSGATNTSPITVVIQPSNETSSQLWPFIQGYTIDIFADGKSIKKRDGVYSCEKLVFSEQYRLPNPWAAMAWVRGQVGNPSPINYDTPAIASQIEFGYSHSYDFTGMCETVPTQINLQNFNYRIYGGVQYQRPYSPDSSGFSCVAYVPRTLPFSGYDFANGQDITENTANIYLKKEGPQTWSDLTDPPSRFITVAKQGGVPVHGIFSGYSDVVGMGTPENRSARIESALLLSSAEKHYPILADTPTPVVVGELVESLIWVGTFNPATDPDLVCKVIAPQLNGHVLYCYSLQALTDKWVKVPERLVGRLVTVTRNGGGTVIVKSTVVGPRGVLVSFPAGGGELELVIG